MLKIDKYSSTWKAVSDLVEQELKQSRSYIEIHGCSELDTTFHRGIIYALKRVNSLESEKTTTTINQGGV